MNTAADDWRTFEGNKIPTKGIKLPQLFFDTLTNLEEEQKKNHQQQEGEDDDDDDVIFSGCEEQQASTSSNKVVVVQSEPPPPSSSSSNSPQQQQQQQTENKSRYGCRRRCRRRRKLQILELGCGCGELSSYLYNRGHDVTGIDINQEAIEIAQKLCPDATFFVEDITNSNNSNISSQKTNDDIIKNNNNKMTTNEETNDNKDLSSVECCCYDLVILQLVLSIVGNVEQRLQTLDYAISKLRPGIGIMYLSCSGVSDKINESYANLYKEDYVSTKEQYTYYSRDPISGEILYTTHHFTIDELQNLLLSPRSSNTNTNNANNTQPEKINDGGGSGDDDNDDKNGRLLEDIHIEQIKEASSRRPNEAAYFLYATAKKKKKEGSMKKNRKTTLFYYKALYYLYKYS